MKLASGSDGSIIIDTELDNSGFESGSKKMDRAIKSVTETVNQMGKQGATAAQSMMPTFSAVSRAAEQTAQSINTATGNAQQMSNAMSGAMSTSDFSKSMTSAERSCASLGTQLQRLGDSERTGIKTDTQMVRFQIGVEKARDSVTRLQQSLAAMGQQKVATPEFEQVAADAQKAEQALFKLYDRRDVMQELGVSQTSREWERLAIQIKNTESILNRYESEMQAMQSAGTAYTNGTDSARYQQTAAALQQMTSNLSHYEEVAAGFDTVSNPAEQSEGALKNVDAELKQKPKDASAASSAFKAFGNALKSVASVGLKAVGTLGRVSFKAIAAGAKSAAGRVAKFARQNTSASLSTKGLVKSLTSLKTMLVSRLKRTLISAIAQDVKLSIQSLARHSKSFDAAMSTMKNSVTGLSGNIAVAFGNIANAVAPAITTIINWISQAISYLNAFFALLSGKSTVTVAKKQTDDYAKSLGGAAGAAKDLKNQVYGFDELNKEDSNSGGGGGGGGATGSSFEEVPIESLLPDSVSTFFDKLKAAFEAGDWTGIGTVIAGGLNTITQTVDNWFVSIAPQAATWSNRIAQILNGLVSEYDWNLLGKTVADGLNIIIDSLAAFVSTFDIGSVGTALGTALNGLVNNIDWTALTHGFTDGFNGIFSAINNFWTTFDFANLGTRLGTALNGIITGVDWGTVGASFAGKWNALISSINGLVTSIDWAAAGSAISSGISGWFNAIKWTELASAVSVGINGIVTGLSTAISEFDWAGAGTTLSGCVNTIFASIDWASAGTLVSDALLGLLDTINTFLETTDWQAIGNDIADFLAAIDWNGLTTSISEGVGAALGGIAALIWGALESAWNEVVQWWYDVAYDDGGFTIGGLLQGILDAIVDVGTWIYDNIFKPFIDGFKAAFGIASPSTVMSEQGGYIISGLWEGISAAWDTFWTDAETLFNSFIDFVSGIWESVSSAATTAWEGITGVLSDAWDGISGTATTVWNGVSNTISGVWNSLSDTATSVWDTVSTTITGAWDGLSSAATTTWDTVSTTISNVWDSLSETATTTWDTVSSTIGGVWDGLKESASTTWEGIKGTVSDWFGQTKDDLDTTSSDIGTNLSTAWDGIKTTASTAWENLKTSVVEWFTGARDDAKGVDWSGVGEGITNGTEGGITGLWADFKSRVVSKFNSLVDGVKSALGIHSPSKVFASIGDYMMQGLDNGLEGSGDAAIKTISGIAGAICDEMASQTPSMTIAGDAVVNGIDNVADKLTGIAATFSAIASMLASVGGFKQPAIAAGMVIPYKTRVAGDIDSTDALEAFTANFDETMSDQIDVMKSQSDILLAIQRLLERLHLTIDGDSLTKAVTRIQREQQRSFGGA